MPTTARRGLGRRGALTAIAASAVAAGAALAPAGAPLARPGADPALILFEAYQRARTAAQAASAAAAQLDDQLEREGRPQLAPRIRLADQQRLEAEHARWNRERGLDDLDDAADRAWDEVDDLAGQIRTARTSTPEGIAAKLRIALDHMEGAPRPEDDPAAADLPAAMVMLALRDLARLVVRGTVTP